MDERINQMIAKKIVLVEIVIEGKTDIGRRAIRGGTLKPCLCNAFDGESGQANRVIIANIVYVIKDKRRMKGV